MDLIPRVEKKRQSVCSTVCLLLRMTHETRTSALLRISTDQNCASYTIRALVGQQRGDIMLVLMESGNN